MDNRTAIEKILRSRQRLRLEAGFKPHASHQDEAEGGCGVIGIACSERVAGRHLLRSLIQMRNRGNGKGGGIAAVGLDPHDLNISRETLDDDYLLAIAVLDESALPEIEGRFIEPAFEVDARRRFPHIPDHTVLGGLQVKPPEAYLYFVRPRAEGLAEFTRLNDLEGNSRRRIEDEFVYQNSYRLNSAFYASTGQKKAFVLSHGKNMLVLKMVGYGDDVVKYYQLEDFHAHIWIGHHRYPTKGRVWHPGGAHPFVGLNEALVHNGDFANYASISEYLAQREIYPLFLTDTEVSALAFDLFHRTYDYPLEYVIETLAPTTERDFTLLPPDKKRVFEQLQLTHMHASPDGPWFFLIAQSDDTESHSNTLPDDLGPRSYRLIGITDTSMLRPQVFAWQEASTSGPAIGFAASEKQAIDAALESLSSQDGRFWSRADRYWNARGGSHTDGGAFIFSAYPDGESRCRLVCTDKFGRRIQADSGKIPYPSPAPPDTSAGKSENGRQGLERIFSDASLRADEISSRFVEQLPSWDYGHVLRFLDGLEASPADPLRSIEILTWLIDRRYPTGSKRRSSLLSLYDRCLAGLAESIRRDPPPHLAYSEAGSPVSQPSSPDQAVLIDGRGYAPEGPGSLALEVVRLIRAGFRRLIVLYARGHRFLGNGLGPGGSGIRIDVYGSPGDYLASGIDGLEIHVHANGQDQLAQIMKSGRLVVYGDVGQTFMYAAKGGEAYVLGNAAGRPLINAVGKPRVVINGTCLDYLAESFMAGDPTNGGGFVILNGIRLDDDGEIHDLDTPYPGGNLFSLASGGAIYLRDPYGRVSPDQLNGGEFAELGEKDWEVIRPRLEENERLFGIPVLRLLEVAGETCPPEQVYRKIQPRALRALQAEEAWVRKHK
jgi:glutamate synthase domain-containing protein 1/glutamate synthase domain-containing protein 3